MDRLIRTFEPHRSGVAEHWCRSIALTSLLCVLGCSADSRTTSVSPTTHTDSSVPTAVASGATESEVSQPITIASAVDPSPQSLFDGTAVRALAGPQGRLVALVFVSTECPIANAMLPDLIEIAKHASERGVAFHLVYPSTWQTREDLLAHAREFGLATATNARNMLLADPSHTLVHLAGVTVVPEAAIFRCDGRGGGELVYRGRVNDLYVGIGRRRPSISSHDLRDAIDTCLAGQPLAQPFPKAVGCFIESSR